MATTASGRTGTRPSSAYSPTLGIQGNYAELIRLSSGAARSGQNGNPSNLFDMPSDRNLKALRLEMIKHLARLPSDDCITGPDRKGYLFSEIGLQKLLSAGEIIGEINARKRVIRLPQTLEEKQALGISLLDAVYSRLPIKVFVPVCPDYGTGDTFHAALGNGIGPEARAAINAIKAITRISQKSSFGAGIRFETKLMVADTEDDLDDIINRCVKGDRGKYRDSCLASARSMEAALSGIPSVKVGTFTELLGQTFRERQYEYEALIRESAGRGGRLGAEIREISSKRTQRHFQILGRMEANGELTIRYMAQYAALGSLARETGSLLTPVVINYETPNIPYFNIGHFHGILRKGEERPEILPVIISTVRR